MPSQIPNDILAEPQLESGPYKSHRKQQQHHGCKYLKNKTGYCHSRKFQCLEGPGKSPEPLCVSGSGITVRTPCGFHIRVILLKDLNHFGLCRAFGGNFVPKYFGSRFYGRPLFVRDRRQLHLGAVDT